MTRLAALLVAIILTSFAQDAPQIQGRVVDDRDAPVAGAVVYLIGGPPPGTHTAITTDEGRFAWTGVAPATYSMSVTKPGYPAIRYGQSRPNGPGLPIEIVAGRPVNLDVRLPRGAVIAGRVLDDAGEPVSGRAIVVSRPGSAAAAIRRAG
jgi:protocatechuate 3,4-dioxygenase beta subunit